MSAEKPFLDTNVLVYCFDPSASRKQERSRSLVAGSCKARLGAISYQVIAEFTNVALRRFAHPMSVGDVRDWIRALSAPLEVVGFSGHLFEQALTLFERYRPELVRCPHRLRRPGGELHSALQRGYAT